jgi:predicted Zn-dependent protease
MKGNTLQNAFITPREKAAIRLHVFGGVDDWRLLFQMAGGETANEKSLTTLISRWKKSEKVKAETETQRRELYAKEQEARDKIMAEILESEKEEETGGSESQAGRSKSRTDYTKPDEQKKLLNDLINNAKDPDAKLDALKIIIAGQRDDRQAAKEGTQVRAFLPLNCRDCILYQREKAKQERKKADNATI